MTTQDIPADAGQLTPRQRADAGAPRQASLPGFGGSAPPFKPTTLRDRNGHPRRPLGYTLFQALFPQSLDAQRVGDYAAALRSELGLAGELLHVYRLHLTLQAIASFAADEDIPQEQLDAAVAAASSIDFIGFPVTFDRVMSFQRSDALVLRCDAVSDAALARLRRPLTAALRRVGLKPKPSETPHMTLLYDRQHVSEQAIPPLRWTADHFALILSHVGLCHHQWLEEWPRPSPQA